MILDGAQIADAAIQGILSRIDQLAAKIGTTAVHIWGVYMAQARVEAIRDTAVAVVLLGATVFLATHVRGLFWQRYKKANEAGPYYDSGEGWAMGAVICGALAAMLVIPVLATFSAALGEWLNPQYWAFQHLTADLKNLF